MRRTKLTGIALAMSKDVVVGGDEMGKRRVLVADPDAILGRSQLAPDVSIPLTTLSLLWGAFVGRGKACPTNFERLEVY